MSIKVIDLNYTYGAGTAFEQHALKHVNFEINDGEFVGRDRPYRFRQIYFNPAPERPDAGLQGGAISCITATSIYQRRL